MLTDEGGGEPAPTRAVSFAGEFSELAPRAQSFAHLAVSTP